MSETVTVVDGIAYKRSSDGTPVYDSGKGWEECSPDEAHLAAALIDKADALATRERELAAARTMQDILREEARIYREQRDQVTVENAQLRECAARLDWLSDSEHHSPHHRFVRAMDQWYASAGDGSLRAAIDAARAQEARDDA